MGRKKKVITQDLPVNEISQEPTPAPEPTPVNEPTPQAPEPPPAPEPADVLPEISTPDEVAAKLADIGSTVKKVSGNAFQKGTGIEDIIKQMNEGGPAPTPAAPQAPEPVKRVGRGRHPKDCKCEKCITKTSPGTEAIDPTKPGEVPPAPATATSAKFDTIAMVVNSTVVPIVSKRWNKDATQVMLKKDQIDHLLTIKPESNMDRPSWVNYTLTAVSMLVMNFMTADTNDQKEIKTLNDALKVYEKMKAEDQETYLDAIKGKTKNSDK